MKASVVLGICLVGIGCSPDTGERQSRPTSTPQSTAQPPLTEDVTLQLDIAASDGRPVIRGTTNLPAGTHLMVSISDTKTDGRYYTGQSKCAVASGGTFQAGPFSKKDSKLEGAYVADVTMPIPKFQPASVKAIIGKNGENLKGPLVKPLGVLPGYVVVEVKQTFVVGGEGAVARQAARQAEALEQCRALYNEVEKLGKEVESARRHPFTPAEWGRFIRSFNTRISDLRNRIDKLEDKPARARFEIGMAAGDLQMLALDLARVVLDGDTSKYDPSKYRERMANARAAIEELAKTQAADDYRTWTSADSEYTVEAKFLSYAVDKVKLEKRNGEQISVPIDRLSEEDREHIESKTGK